jgi:hypothetical protein
MNLTCFNCGANCTENITVEDLTNHPYGKWIFGCWYCLSMYELFSCDGRVIMRKR